MKKQELFNNVTEGSPYQRQPKQMGLYNAAYEHDACGVGMLVNIHGEKSHDIVESALKVLENMQHDTCTVAGFVIRTFGATVAHVL